MAADEKKKESTPAAGATQTAGQTKIVWDDSNMRSVYANVSNVAGGREEIVLLFGMNQAWHAGQSEVKEVLLNNVVADYERKFGKLEIGVERPAGAPVQ
jgi:hypothetical protein